ncbi:SUF system NifU family Fe-S cluster assembly protein [Candidatus Gottesmanbacteria bacterium RBG_13_45_10]|uniref:SUF system NifU family Fe-S cluster assembly protein n=1 Tax=Candidatus Gottesmanbacteria bacterium RBG_13_45_10 TaxID=1798370 RepID=A0A1F5ZGI4_9BACT|nr:MAG: SUF system NifU family Fe-S cluster assembly protein [Candidatus Gottesmanbacteria bacterium RBG_13_45_10]
MDLYREVILDHYKHPRNFGKLHDASATAQAYNATCGDRIIMEVKVNTKGKIEDIRFSGVGCAISQASASMLTEKVKHKSLDSVMKISSRDIMKMLGTTLTPSRIKCATLPLEVLQKAVIAIRPLK